MPAVPRRAVRRRSEPFSGRCRTRRGSNRRFSGVRRRRSTCGRAGGSIRRVLPARRRDRRAPRWSWCRRCARGARDDDAPPLVGQRGEGGAGVTGGAVSGESVPERPSVESSGTSDVTGEQWSSTGMNGCGRLASLPALPTISVHERFEQRLVRGVRWGRLTDAWRCSCGPGGRRASDQRERGLRRCCGGRRQQFHRERTEFS